MIGGFEEPTSGMIRLHGENVTGLKPYRRPVNTVFQSYALFPHLSIYENVAFGFRRSKVADDDVKRRVGEVLELVQLVGREHRRPRQLSGGQQQRVALAQRSVNHPRVLLLDEPLGALDLKLRKEMQIELKRIQQEVGITFIHVTHDQEEAMTMADTIAVMHKGRIERMGDSDRDIRGSADGVRQWLPGCLEPDERESRRRIVERWHSPGGGSGRRRPQETSCERRPRSRWECARRRSSCMLPEMSPHLRTVCRGR